MQVTLTCSNGSSVIGSIGRLPWSSKSQTGMSRMVCAWGVPGLTSILIERPSRCMWPATPWIVIGSASVRTHDCISPGSGLAAAEEVEEVGGVALGAEALLDVGQGRVAVAQLAVGVLRAARQLDRARAAASCCSAW